LLSLNPYLLIRGVLRKRNVQALRRGKFHLRCEGCRQRKVENIERRNIGWKCVAGKHSPVEKPIEELVGRWVGEFQFIVGLFVFFVRLALSSVQGGRGWRRIRGLFGHKADGSVDSIDDIVDHVGYKGCAVRLRKLLR